MIHKKQIANKQSLSLSFIIIISLISDTEFAWIKISPRCTSLFKHLKWVAKAVPVTVHQHWPSPGQNKCYDDLFFSACRIDPHQFSEVIKALVGYMWLKTFTGKSVSRNGPPRSLYFHWPIKHNRDLIKTTFSLRGMSNPWLKLQISFWIKIR